MHDNKNFVFESLKLLEKYQKFKEIQWLSESYFCEVKFGITWSDENGAKLPILKVLYPQLDKDIAIKSKNDKDVYYPQELVLNGIPFLVYNNWIPDVRSSFFTWVKDVLGEDSLEIEEIKNKLLKA